MLSAADPAPDRHSARRRVSRLAWLGGAAVLLAGLILLILATLDFGWARGRAERSLTHLLGRRVTIGSVERIDAVSLAPRVRLRNVRIAQPGWAGSGDMVVLREAVVRVPVLPLLFGHPRPTLLIVDGARLALVHDAGTRANWRIGRADQSLGSGPGISSVELRDVRFTLDDAHGKIRLAGTAASDAAGFRILAQGTQRGVPAHAALTGAAVIGSAANRPWTFHANYAGRLAGARIDATADHPLDFHHFAGTAAGWGRSLQALGDLIHVDLFETRPVRLRGTIVHAGQRWELGRMSGRLGTSDLAGQLAIDRIGGRSRVDAALRAHRFDFDDLATDASNARDAAQRRRIGPRIVPSTRIDLSKIRMLDGRLTFHADRLHSNPPSIFRSLDATLVLDHARLTLAPVSAAITQGRLIGRATVDHPAGQRLPRLAVDLRLVGGRLEEFNPGGDFAGPMRGRLILTGSGMTVRDAIARANGSVAFTARDGTVAATVAEGLGRNFGRVLGLLIHGGDRRVPLRCLAVRYVARGGVLRPSLFTIDTGVMRADGRGEVLLDGERLALTVDGRSKHPSIIRLPKPIQVRGTLSNPVIQTDDAGLGSAKTIVHTLGATIGRIFGQGSKQVPPADVNCNALIAKAGV